MVHGTACVITMCVYFYIYAGGAPLSLSRVLWQRYAWFNAPQPIVSLRFYAASCAAVSPGRDGRAPTRLPPIPRAPPLPAACTTWRLQTPASMLLASSLTTALLLKGARAPPLLRCHDVQMQMNWWDALWAEPEASPEVSCIIHVCVWCQMCVLLVHVL